MPVVSPHRSSASALAGNYRSTFSTSTLDRPYFSSSSYSPRITSYSERYTQRTYTDADGRRVFSRSGSITEDGVTTRFREDSRENSVVSGSRRDSLSRDSGLGSTTIRENSVSDYPSSNNASRRESSVGRGDSSSSRLSAINVLDSVAELRNKYSPANYVPACMRGRNNRDQQQNNAENNSAAGGAISRSKSINDIGLPPIESSSSTKSGGSAFKKNTLKVMNNAAAQTSSTSESNNSANSSSLINGKTHATSPKGRLLLQKQQQHNNSSSNNSSSNNVLIVNNGFVVGSVVGNDCNNSIGVSKSSSSSVSTSTISSPTQSSSSPHDNILINTTNNDNNKHAKTKNGQVVMATENTRADETQRLLLVEDDNGNDVMPAVIKASVADLRKKFDDQVPFHSNNKQQSPPPPTLLLSSSSSSSQPIDVSSIQQQGTSHVKISDNLFKKQDNVEQAQAAANGVPAKAKPGTLNGTNKATGKVGTAASTTRSPGKAVAANAARKVGAGNKAATAATTTTAAGTTTDATKSSNRLSTRNVNNSHAETNGTPAAAVVKTTTTSTTSHNNKAVTAKNVNKVCQKNDVNNSLPTVTVNNNNNNNNNNNSFSSSSAASSLIRSSSEGAPKLDANETGPVKNGNGIGGPTSSAVIADKSSEESTSGSSTVSNGESPSFLLNNNRNEQDSVSTASNSSSSSRVNNFASYIPSKDYQKGDTSIAGSCSDLNGTAGESGLGSAATNGESSDPEIHLSGSSSITTTRKFNTDLSASPKFGTSSGSSARSTLSPSAPSSVLNSNNSVTSTGTTTNSLSRRSVDREGGGLTRTAYGNGNEETATSIVGGGSTSVYDKYTSTGGASLNNNNNLSNSLATTGGPSIKTLGLNGLKNIGNTCFMNSVIQCLSNTKLLLEYLLKDHHLADMNTTISGMKGALIKAFAEVIKELWSEDSFDRVVNTTSLKSQIQRFAPRFIGYAQQDAQEFLRYLLEGLHEDVNRVTEKPKPILTEIDEKLSDSEKAAESWLRYLRMDNSKIVDVFVGQLKSTLKCTHCGHCSVTFDPFWDLSLPIPQRVGQIRLSQCLDSFTREETLDGDEKPTCSKCKERRKCTKSFAIQKFPKVLVIHLKRFSLAERFRGKLSVTVDFPLEGLDMSPYAANNVQSCRYNLYAVSNHSGTTYSGHYTAYCRHPYTKTWHEYNDSRVSSISPKSIVSGEAYVLFYEQESQRSHL